MRLAGRKKDGAWVRTNKALRKMAADNNAALATLSGQLAANALVTDMAQAYIDILATAGVDSQLGTDTLVNAWVTKGIPREVWFGYSRVDTMEQVAAEGSGNTYFRPQHAAQLRAGAAELRAVITLYLQGQRMSLDIANAVPASQGNPGGIADGQPDAQIVVGAVRQPIVAPKNVVTATEARQARRSARAAAKASAKKSVDGAAKKQ